MSLVTALQKFSPKYCSDVVSPLLQNNPDHEKQGILLFCVWVLLFSLEICICWRHTLSIARVFNMAWNTAILADDGRSATLGLKF